MKISLVVLTYNRIKTADRCLSLNIASAGHPIHEIIHVDNGSTEQTADGVSLVNYFRSKYKPSVQIINRENLGVSKGYNRGMAMATGTHIVITGCDRIMPDQWLDMFVHSATIIQNTGVISWYSHPTKASVANILHERYAGDEFFVEDCGYKFGPFQPCLPAEARFHSRSFLQQTGYFREDFGLYGYEDVEWSERAARVARENGLINYTLNWVPLAEHIDDDFQMPDGNTYRHFKATENGDPRKEALAKLKYEEESPYYNPYV